jgi:chromatin segregation and condensation protein Rec8/ScpA/Scc1 (kleisin family)
VNEIEREAELDTRLRGDLDELRAFAEELGRASDTRRDGSSVFPRHINADPEAVEEGLARLVLALVDLIRQLLEKQAIRRIEGGSLTDDEIERMGVTFLKLERKMTELKEMFGLQDDDLALKLGPVRDLLSG